MADGRAVLVTGGAHGIGAAMVRRFAAAGHQVAIADVDATAGAEVAGETGGHFIRTDVGVVHSTAAFKRTSRARVNHEPVHFFGSHQEQLTVEIETYNDESGGADSNMWDCSSDPQYQHPYGVATGIKYDGSDKVGDAALCFLPLGRRQTR